MSRFLILLLLSLSLGSTLHSQQSFILFERPTGKIELPFEYVNNFIVVDVVFNDLFPLKFVFDTGAENTILTRKEITDLLRINYQREIDIYGSDLSTPLTAYIAPGINMSFKDKELLIKSQSILVMKEDYFRFEEYAGIEIHGILGADVLRRFIVTINFRRRTITLEDPTDYTRPSRRFQEVKTDFFRHKPYLMLPGSIVNEPAGEFRLLMDTGASLALLLYTHADSRLQMPEQLIRTTIGRGLGGSLEGFVGRTAQLSIGKQQMQSIITNFQDLNMYENLDSAFLQGRHGIVGNVILQRFQIVIDYITERVYLKPNRDFKMAFRYDRSGLSLIASGENLNRFVVLHVIEGSPAAEAGLRKGDEIRNLNGVPAKLRGLENMVRLLQRKPGKKINLLVKRDQERFYTEFTLRDLI